MWRTEVRLDQIPRSEGTIRAEGDYCVVARQSAEALDGPMRFEFTIPKEGPLTYDGKLMRVIWELVAGTQAGKNVKVAERRGFSVSARPAA